MQGKQRKKQHGTGKNTKKIPAYFAPILWSHDISKLDPEKHRKTIVVHTINYGDLRHWRWLVRQYGTEEIRSLLSKIPATELRPRSRRLACTLFHIQPNNAPRGTRSQK